MAKPLFDITPFTLLDYPHKAACIFWFVGCNMRCQYCYNPDIVFGKGKISVDDAVLFLKSRKGLLQAVVLSGGECSIHKDVKTIAQKAKDLGYLVKIDTNGTSPKTLAALLDEGLVDYVALDLKALKEDFRTITAANTFHAFEESYRILQSSNISFEVRSTVHSALHSRANIEAMIEYLYDLNYRGTYYLQVALNNVRTITDLPDSTYNIANLNFETTKLPVVIRG